MDPAGQLVGEGHNTVRADLDPTAHGEIVAIRAAWRRLGAWRALRGATLYTSCEPCLLSFVIAQTDVGRVVFAARATDVPGYRPVLGADLTGVAAWVNARPDWTPIEVVPDFMREQALAIITVFPWRAAASRASVRAGVVTRNRRAALLKGPGPGDTVSRRADTPGFRRTLDAVRPVHDAL